MSKKTEQDNSQLEELRLRSQKLFKRAAELAEEAKAISRKVDQLAAKKKPEPPK